MVSRLPDLPEVWIGLLEVHPRPDCIVLGGAKGAYTTALAWALDPPHYLTQVREALAGVKLDLAESEDVEPLLMRRLREEVNPEVLRLAEEVKRTRTPRLTPFHLWSQEEEAAG